MRAITGALLIVAASILAGASIIAMATSAKGGEAAGIVIAFPLGLIGLALLVVGLAKDRRQ